MLPNSQIDNFLIVIVIHMCACAFYAEIHNYNMSSLFLLFVCIFVFRAEPFILDKKSGDSSLGKASLSLQSFVACSSVVRVGTL